MSLAQYNSNIHEFIVAKEQFDMFSNVFMSTLDALETNPKTKKLAGFKRTYLSLGIESIDLKTIYQDLEIATENDGERRLAAKLGIGAMTQKLIDLIKVIFNRLLGRNANQLAETIMSILATVKEINGVRYTKVMHHRLPTFINSQEEKNWDTVWSNYKDRIGELDARVNKVSTRDFYMNYKVPKDKEFYRLAGDSVASKVGVPICYAHGERPRCLNEYLGLLGECRSVLEVLRAVEINETDILTYDKNAVDTFIDKVKTIYDTNWRKVKYNDTKIAPVPEWPATYSQSDIILLRRIDECIKDLKQEAERIANRIDLQRRITTAIAQVPEERRSEMSSKLRTAANTWARHVGDTLSLISHIHINMSSTDQRLEQNLKAYRRTLDLIHRG